MADSEGTRVVSLLPVLFVVMREAVPLLLFSS